LLLAFWGENRNWKAMGLIWLQHPKIVLKQFHGIFYRFLFPKRVLSIDCWRHPLQCVYFLRCKCQVGNEENCTSHRLHGIQMREMQEMDGTRRKFGSVLWQLKEGVTWRPDQLNAVLIRPNPDAVRWLMAGVLFRCKMHRPIGRYRRPKRRKSLTCLNTTRHLLCVYFRLRTAHWSCKRCESWGVRSLVLKNVFDFLSLERR